MKKFFIELCGTHGRMKKILLTMKLTIVVFFLGLISLSASTYSQNKKLTLDMEGVTLFDVFKQIESQSEFVFIYKSETVDLRKKVNIKVEETTVDQILESVLKDSGIKFEINKKQIILTPDRTIPAKKAIEEEKQQPQKKDKKDISGTVKDSKGLALPGATVVVKGATIGTITDSEGKFTLSVPLDSKILSVSFVGFKTQELGISSQFVFNLTLQEETTSLEEVVAVGYGVQKKASVVGAISTTTNKELSRAGGVSNLAMALTGQLPGLTTIQVTGQPGKEDPIIYIRGQGTWNGGQPLILVDGVERKMNDLDVSEVDNISVLKDASATAVYGVKGANGVILITTKRGAKGKPQLSLSANSTVRFPALLVDKLDAYDTYMVKNSAIEREVPLLESMWGDYTPLAIAQRYRNQSSLKWPEAYPNVDWQKEGIKDFTSDHRVNMNVSGGTDFARYFSSLAYSTEGDLIKVWDNGRGYKPGYGYDKFNFRTNLDLNLTRTTSLKFNMAGVYSMLKSFTGLSENGIYQALIAMQSLPPNAFLPRYADGRWGQNPNTDSAMANSIAYLANQGYTQTNATDIATDIGITQKLDGITRGLSVGFNLSFDNHFESVKSISESWPGFAAKYIDPAIEDMPAGGDPNQYIILYQAAGVNQFAYVQAPWVLNDENAESSGRFTPLGNLRRRLYYQAQLNYTRTFGKHDVTATGVFTREQLATGSEFQRYREDWVGRATYNYDSRYFAEFNGAYNGSEKFGPVHRFAFFPSGAVGWILSEEKFMRSMKNSWLDKLKLRFSYGKIGDDGGISQRWLYQTQWAYSGQMPLSQYFPTSTAQRSPYIMYSERTVGNEDIHWETALKSNLGLEMAVLKNTLSGNFEYFTEDRTGILLVGSSRVVPSYFGTDAPTGNVGRVTKKGYELELHFNKNLNNWHFWADASMTHAVDKIMYKEEPELKDSHLKAQGFQIDQTRSVISTGYMQTWDDVYANAPSSSNDAQKLPGNYFLLDFDADGVIDGNKDIVPYGYSNRPQNNYNLSLGADYKGFSLMVQFYGVNNVTRTYGYTSFGSNFDIAYSYALDHWSKDNPDASSFLPRWKTQTGQNSAQYFQYDGSYLRLKTAELAYTFTGAQLKHTGLSSLKLYLNGNNLFFWSKLPDDRELGSENKNVYPTSKRINLGIDIKF